MVQQIFSYISFLILLSSFGYSQNYSYLQYTTEDGLPTNYVYGVLEDQKGYIWAFTENGVSKFDGYEFKNFSVKDGLIYNDIVYMEEDSSGVLWLHGIHNHIQYIKNDSIFTFSGLSNDRIVTVRKYFCNTDLNHSEFYTTHQKNKYTNYKFLNGKIIDSLVSFNIFKNSPHYREDYKYPYFRALNKERFYNLSQDGKVYYEIINDSLHSLNITSHVKNKNNLLATPINSKNPFNILINNDNLTFVDLCNRKQKHIILSELLGFISKELSLQRIDDLIIIQSSFGYIEIDFDWNILKVIRFQEKIHKYGIKRSVKDSHGNLWIGTKDAGLLLITNSYLKNPLIPTLLSENQSFNKLYTNKNGQIHSISDKGELCIIEEDTFRHVLHMDLNGANIRNISIVNDEHIIVSNAFKTLILDNYETFDLSNHSYYRNIYSDLSNEENSSLKRFDDIYLNTELDQLFCSFPDRNAKIITKKNGRFTEKNLNVLGKFFYQDTIKNIVYLSGSEGLFKLDDTQSTELIIKLKAITSFWTIDNNSYLIGTESNGLYHYQLSTKKLTKLNNYAYIRKITKEDDFYYLASNEGVIVGKIVDTEWQPIYTFNKKDGLQSEEIRDILIQKDYIYATSFKGIIKLSKHCILNQKKLNSTNEKLTINEVYSISKDEEVIDSYASLAYYENDLSFNYHLQNYDSNGDIQYEYKLDPIQSEWQTTTDRIQRFFNLQAADYTFHLKATDAFGHEYYLKEPYSFQIKEPYWKTWWFTFISIFILISGILYYLKIKADRGQREIEAEKALHTKISRFKIEALRSQMNPHFVFNALSSIQFYIQKNNPQKADQYLTMFGGLIRKYLDFSQVKSITIKDEIELLQDYLRLEEMRFESLFTSEIIVDPRLDIHYSYIPTMLVQPYVENAINHGLQQRRDGKGILWIEFKKIYTDGLRISINDNGIGIEKSKKNKSDYHKSHGMSNIMDRISFLKESQELEIDLQINTVSNNSEFPGTKIIIEIKEL